MNKIQETWQITMRRKKEPKPFFFNAQTFNLTVNLGLVSMKDIFHDSNLIYLHRGYKVQT